MIGGSPEGGAERKRREHFCGGGGGGGGSGEGGSVWRWHRRHIDRKSSGEGLFSASEASCRR